MKLKQCGRIDEIHRRFEAYLESGESAGNCRHHWYIGPNMLIDKFVRMEYLREDLNGVFNHLCVPVEIFKKILSRIPKFKDFGRIFACLNVADYFTDMTLKVVNEWFSLGGYVKYDSVIDLEYSQ